MFPINKYFQLAKYFAIYFSDVTPCNMFYILQLGGGKRMPSPPSQVVCSINYMSQINAPIHSHSQSKCVSVCKISPEVDRGILSADLSMYNKLLAIPQQSIIRGATPSLFSDHVCSKKCTSWANISVTENFTKIKIFNLKSNFDQASQKKIKKAMLYGKINFKNANYHDIIFMPKANAPNHNYKKALLYYLANLDNFGKCFRPNEASYGDSDIISRSFILMQNLNENLNEKNLNDKNIDMEMEMEIAIYFNINMFKTLENLAVHPNHEPTFYEEGFAQNLRWVLPKNEGFAQNLTSITGNSLQGMGFAQNLRWVIPNKLIFLSSNEYNSLHNHAEHFDQQMGARHLLLGSMDIKIMKTCTIILIGGMITAIKALATFILSLCALALSTTILIYGWLPTHIAWVMMVVTLLTSFGKIFNYLQSSLFTSNS